MLAFLAWSFVIYIALLAVLYFSQNKFVYFPPTPSDQEQLAGFDDIRVQTRDELELSAYFFPPIGNKPIIIVFHGNASQPSWEVFKFRELMADGYGILLAEYRGYGGNPGRPNEQGLMTDGQAYLDWLGQGAYGQNPLVLFGESLGTGVAVNLAATNKNIAALVLEAPYDSIIAVATHHYKFAVGLRHWMRNKYESDRKIQDVKIPVLFMLAGDDRIVPKALGERLASMANQPKEIAIFEGASHTGIFHHGGQARLKHFLQKYVGQP